MPPKFAFRIARVWNAVLTRFAGNRAVHVMMDTRVSQVSVLRMLVCLLAEQRFAAWTRFAGNRAVHVMMDTRVSQVSVLRMLVCLLAEQRFAAWTRSAGR